MTHKILLPTDFSKNAWHAICYAIELYKKETCQFYILNVFNGSNDIIGTLINMDPGSDLFESAKLDSENNLAKILDMITLKDYKNTRHRFETVSKFNNTVEAIKNMVEEKDIEMIVMGTKGETNSTNKLLGSVATNVMEKVRNCPVLVIPERAKQSMPKEIVFPSSFKTHIKKRELNYLIELAKNCDASIRVLHVSEESKLSKAQLSNKKLLEEYFEDVVHSFHTLSPNDIPTAIYCFMESRDSDMVAFINKKHTFFGNMFTKPLVKQIGHVSKVPILVMHDLRN